MTGQREIEDMLEKLPSEEGYWYNQIYETFEVTSESHADQLLTAGALKYRYSILRLMLDHFEARDNARLADGAPLHSTTAANNPQDTSRVSHTDEIKVKRCQEESEGLELMPPPQLPRRSPNASNETKDRWCNSDTEIDGSTLIASVASPESCGTALSGREIPLPAIWIDLTVASPKHETFSPAIQTDGATLSRNEENVCGHQDAVDTPDSRQNTLVVDPALLLSSPLEGSYDSPLTELKDVEVEDPAVQGPPVTDSGTAQDVKPRVSHLRPAKSLAKSRSTNKRAALPEQEGATTRKKRRRLAWAPNPARQRIHTRKAIRRYFEMMVEGKIPPRHETKAPQYNDNSVLLEICRVQRLTMQGLTNDERGAAVARPAITVFVPTGLLRLIHIWKVDFTMQLRSDEDLLEEMKEAQRAYSHRQVASSVKATKRKAKPVAQDFGTRELAARNADAMSAVDASINTVGDAFTESDFSDDAAVDNDDEMDTDYSEDDLEDNGCTDDEYCIDDDLVNEDADDLFI